MMKKYSEVLCDELWNTIEESAKKDVKSGKVCMFMSIGMMALTMYFSSAKKLPISAAICGVGCSLFAALGGIYAYHRADMKLDRGLAQCRAIDLQNMLADNFENLWLNSYGMKDATKEEIDQYFKEKRQRNAYNILKRFNDNLNKGE